MRCDRHALSLYADGELSRERVGELTLHIAACQSCRQELIEIQRVNHILSSWGSVRQPVPTSTERRVHASVERRGRLSPVFRFSRLSPPAVGSSVAALVLLLTANLGSMYQAASPPRTPPAQVAHLIKRQSAPLQLARGRAAVVTTQPNTLPRLLVRRHIEALVD
jgi:anti-sigma factor RsiW